MQIIETEAKHNENFRSVYPTAIATKQILKNLPVTNYSDLKDRYSHADSARVVLWLKKMQAGTGSSIKRDLYLKKLGINKSELGAKGTDLFLPKWDNISLAETQIIQAMKLAESDSFYKIILHDIVSDETDSSISSIWDKMAFEKDVSYKKCIENSEKISFFKKSFQQHIPTIDQFNNLTVERKSPGGHGLFGVEAIMNAIDSSSLPKVNPDNVLISSIGNGEDLSSGPDYLMTGWMAKESIPIAMVTTSKTNNDLKGGQIALFKEDQRFYVTIVEKAQAESAGQLGLFEKLGLRKNDGEAFFNTNMLLINYTALTPLLQRLQEKIGREKFFEILSPDLIQNIKSQKDSKGVEKKFIQLEGAMGSVALNLDYYWRRSFGTPLVYILNVDTENRTDFFSPVKTAFDFYMQFYTDRFRFDSNTFKLKSLNKKFLPMVNFTSSRYKEIQNVLDDFKNIKILNLNSLNVFGNISMDKIELVGNIIIENHFPASLNINEFIKNNKSALFKFEDGLIILENIKIVAKKNRVLISPIKIL